MVVRGVGRAVFSDSTDHGGRATRAASRGSDTASGDHMTCRSTRTSGIYLQGRNCRDVRQPCHDGRAAHRRAVPCVPPLEWSSALTTCTSSCAGRDKFVFERGFEPPPVAHLHQRGVHALQANSASLWTVKPFPPSSPHGERQRRTSVESNRWTKVVRIRAASALFRGRVSPLSLCVGGGRQRGDVGLVGRSVIEVRLR